MSLPTCCSRPARAPPAKYDGRTALQAAASGGHHVALDMLLKAGAEVNALPAKYSGCSALAAATEGGHQNALETLRKASAA